MSVKDSDAIGLALLAIMVLLCVVMLTGWGCTVGIGIGNDQIYEEAFKNGAGHYEANPKTGDKVWKWTGAQEAQDDRRPQQ